MKKRLTYQDTRYSLLDRYGKVQDTCMTNHLVASCNGFLELHDHLLGILLGRHNGQACCRAWRSKSGFDCKMSHF